MTDQPNRHVRLRAPASAQPFHVVLVEPEIPPNTGNVARLCGATSSVLHLVGKLGFRIDEHAVRRAGLDYWHLVDVRTHATLAEAEANIAAGRPPGAALASAGLAEGERAQARRPSWLLSGRGLRSYVDVAFEPGDVFVFGKESVGLSEQLLAERSASVIAIPVLGAVRSHNLANAVAIVVYEALRQTGQLAAAVSAP